MDECFLEMSEAAQEAMRAQAQAAVASKALPETVLAPHEYKRYTCEDCDDDLPTFRMQKGLTICTPCKTAKETEQKRRRM